MFWTSPRLAASWKGSISAIMHAGFLFSAYSIPAFSLPHLQSTSYSPLSEPLAKNIPPLYLPSLLLLPFPPSFISRLHLCNYFLDGLLSRLPLFPSLYTRTCSVAQSSLTLDDPIDYSLPGSSVHGISQAKILEWIAFSFLRNFHDPRI